MRQEIYDDQYGIDAWDVNQASRCFVHILNSTQWESATDKPVPGQPPSAEAYTKAGLPWFDYYADGLTAVSGAKKLAGLDSVAAKGIKAGEKPLPANNPITPTNVVPIGSGSAKVKEGNW